MLLPASETSAIGAPVRPPIPPDEDQRLEDLRRLDLLLTEPEELFDEITRELARIFDVPGVVMSFTDGDTQYYKSEVGMPPEFAATRSEPRELSVCSFVIGTNQTLVIEDLLADERFRDNPVVLSSGARFYAGAPLQAESGRAVGTLCIVDTRPRVLGDRELDLLRLIADGVMARVRLQSASRELLRRTRTIERDLQQARQMQRFLLPPKRVEGEGWRISSLYRPFEQVGGDFLDVHQKPDGRRVILVADVTGHGTSAALISAMTKTAFHRAAGHVDTPASLLEAIHDELTGMVRPGHFITALAAVFDPAARRIQIASAGHPCPLLISEPRVEMVRHENELPLLVAPDQVYRQETTLDLHPGERLLVYTDGAIEAADGEGTRLGIEGFGRTAHDVARAHPDDFLHALFARLLPDAGHRVSDDVAMLCVELL